MNGEALIASIYTFKPHAYTYFAQFRISYKSLFKEKYAPKSLIKGTSLIVFNLYIYYMLRKNVTQRAHSTKQPLKKTVALNRSTLFFHTI